MIIERVTELGADEIIPLRTKRTEMDLKGDRLAKMIARYHDVAVNAAKQSGRLRVPVIHPVTDLTVVLKSFPERTTVFIPSLSGERKNILEAFKAVPSSSRVAFLIGPEGDFTPAEIEEAVTRGFRIVNLGRNVLKSDTAGLAALAILNYEFSS